MKNSILATIIFMVTFCCHVCAVYATINLIRDDYFVDQTLIKIIIFAMFLIMVIFNWSLIVIYWRRNYLSKWKEWMNKYVWYKLYSTWLWHQFAKFYVFYWRSHFKGEVLTIEENERELFLIDVWLPNGDASFNPKNGLGLILSEDSTTRSPNNLNNEEFMDYWSTQHPNYTYIGYKALK